MLQSTLGMDELFHISHCKRTTKIWDSLQVRHEVTNEEQGHMTLLVSHHFDDDNEVNNDKLSYDELHDAFNNLHDECLKLYRLNVKQTKIIASL